MYIYILEVDGGFDYFIKKRSLHKKAQAGRLIHNNNKFIVRKLNSKKKAYILESIYYEIQVKI